MDTTHTQGLSRRHVMRGAAWAAPSLTIVGVSPALAASSPALSGCYTINYSGATRGGVQGYSGTLSGSVPGTSATMNYTISQSRASGLPQGPTNAGPTPTQGDFAVVTATSNNLGASVYTYGGPSTPHWSGTTVNPLLVASGQNYLLLNQSNQGSNTASETITFNFGTTQIPTSISFTIYDITRVYTGSGQQAYQDTITLNQSATLSGTGASLLNTKTPSAGTAFYSPNQYPSNTSTTLNTNVSISSRTSSQLTLTYSNPTFDPAQATDYMQSQYIAISPITVCY